MIRVESEIGQLERVLLHRPGRELERLTPKYLQEMLFEDIPWLKQIQVEHDAFAQTLRDNGCEVLYYEQLLRDVLARDGVRAQLIEALVDDCRVGSERLKHAIREHLEAKSTDELAETAIAGLEKASIQSDAKRLADYITEVYPFYINPLTNLYFTRDPGAVIGATMAINAMRTQARARESLCLRFIRDHHPVFAPDGNRVPTVYLPEDVDSIEGGDILVLNSDTIAVGCSARTSPEAVERLALRLFALDDAPREVLALQIPFVREFMHLDTVLTMVDVDAFAVYPGVIDRIALFSLTPSTDGVRVDALDGLRDSLAKVLRLPAVRFIETGGGDLLTAAREQWNDSTNTLALRPGVVATYDRNVASNDTLREAGITVVEISGSELVRGRGGPRCMSMPLNRAPL